MSTQLKVGSVFRIPILAGWKVASGNPAVLQATVANDIVTFLALKIGTAAVTLTLANDLTVNLQVSITAS